MNYTQHLMELSPSYDGSVESLLLQTTGDENKKNILYIHGFSDYFFHDHLAEYFVNAGYNFFAIDLRRYARAKKPHQKIYFIESVDEYFEELQRSLQIIERQSKAGTIVLGHSMGGLVASLFCEKFIKKYKIDALVLNSPFFEFFLSKNMKGLMKNLAYLFAPLGRYIKLPKPTGSGLAYTMCLHKKYYGEWEYSLDYKLEKGNPIYARWVLAIVKAHKKVQAGLNLNIPVLVLHPSQSLGTKQWVPEAMMSDLILSVRHMKRYSPSLGQDVDLVEVKDAMHDVYLSKPEARNYAMNATTDWLKEKLS